MALGWGDGDREQGKGVAGAEQGEQEECDSTGTSSPTTLSIGALIWQGDGSSCRGCSSISSGCGLASSVRLTKQHERLSCLPALTSSACSGFC